MRTTIIINHRESAKRLAGSITTGMPKEMWNKFGYRLDVDRMPEISHMEHIL